MVNGEYNTMNSYLKLIKKRVIRFNSNIKCFIGGRYLLTWIDEIFSFLAFGASPDDYFRYEFYKKSWYERNKFITYRRSKKLINKYSFSDADAVKMFNDKAAMNLFFKDYIKREWLDLDVCSDKDFSMFVEKYERVIMKPKGGSGGRGIFILNRNEMPKTTKEYSGYIAEQILVQHPELSKLNNSSVNTLRVMTFKSKVISCVLKVGRGNAVVDNMCSDGMYGNVNLKYGITDSVFLDIGLNRYYFHPYSGEKLCGIKIPYWDKIVEYVEETAKKLPTMEYLGWDIAILPDGPAVIEANEAPGHDLSCQSTAQVGLYDKIKELAGQK